MSVLFHTLFQGLRNCESGRVWGKICLTKWKSNEYSILSNNLKNYILTHNTYSEDIPVPALIKIQDPKISVGIGTLIQKSTLKETLKQSVTENYPPYKKLVNEIEIAKNTLLENIENLKKINTRKQ